MPSLKTLHERSFAGKPLKSFKVYNDPFGESELCIELAFVDGQIECLEIGPGRPELVSRGLRYEESLAGEQSHVERALSDHRPQAVRTSVQKEGQA